MSLFKRSISFTILLLSVVLFSSGCKQGSSGNKGDKGDNDNSKLVVTEFPANGVSIGQHTKLVFSFNNPVDITSVVISGTLYDDCNGGIWSSVTHTNDTLTISPANRWTTGPDQTISIDAINALGETVSFAYNYTVINQVIYVSPAGHDYSPGSLTQPKKTIQAAITQAIESHEVTEIHVAEGTYQATVQEGTDLKITDGILLYGGYSASNWSVRDSQIYETIIEDHSMSGEHNSLISFGEEINDFAVVDGFTLKAGSGSTSSVVNINSSAVLVSNNKIKIGTAYATNYGIYVNENKSPIIENNTIIGTSSKNMYGIYSKSANPKIIKNTIAISDEKYMSKIIYGIYSIDAPIVGPIISQNNISLNHIKDASDYTTYCIYTENSAVTVTRNFITVNPSYYEYGIYAKNSTIAIVNNIVDLNANGHGIVAHNYPYEDAINGYILNNTIIGYGDGTGISHSNVKVVQNNLISGTRYAFSSTDYKSGIQHNNMDSEYYYSSGSSYYKNLSGSNIALNTLFANKLAKDFNLTTNTSKSIAENGKDGSAYRWLFNYDYNGNIRTGNGETGWSIGAYEFDGATGIDYPIDSYENDDTFATATPIEYAIAQDHNLHTRNDVDFYSFTVPVEMDNFEYNILTSHEKEDYNSTFEIYDSAYTLIATSQNNYVSVQLPSGNYYIKVISHQFVGTGQYSITLNVPVDPYESNDNYSNATDLAIGSTLLTTLHTYDSDYYKFEVDTNHDISIEVKDILYNLDIAFTLYVYEDRGSGLNYYQVRNVNNSGANGIETTALTLDPGTYYIVTSAISSTTGFYSITLTGNDLTAPDAFESNNSFAEAAPIQMGTTLQATIPPGDNDYYSFVTTTVENVTITINNVMYNLDAYLTIYDSNHNQVDYQNTNGANGSETITLTLQPDTYYIRIYGVSSSIGNYSLSITGENLVVDDIYESNNDYLTATPFQLGTTINASITSNDDDYYSFDVADIEDITISAFIITYGLKVYIAIYDSNHNLVTSTYSTTANLAKSLTYTLYPGSYYVRIADYEPSLGNYSLTISSTTRVTDDSFESNNDFTEATSIQMDSTSSASLLEGDVDYYSFEVTSVYETTITLSNVLYDLDVSLEILDSSQTQINFVNNNGANADETLTEILQPGTYYIIASRVNNTLGSYNLQLNGVNLVATDTNESNNTYAEATTIPFEAPLSASLSASDIDYYTFQLTETKELLITSGNVGANLDISMEILDSTQSQLNLINTNGLGGSETITTTLDAGTYYIAVNNMDSSFGNYTLNIHDTSLPSSETKTGNIGQVTGGSMNLDFTIPAAATAYTITLEMRGDLGSSAETGAVTIGSQNLGSFYTGSDGDVFITVLTDQNITSCGSPGQTVTLTADFTPDVNFAPGTMTSYAEVRATINYTY